MDLYVGIIYRCMDDCVNTFLSRKQFSLTSGTDNIPQLACCSFSLEEADKIVAALLFREVSVVPDFCTASLRSLPVSIEGDEKSSSCKITLNFTQYTV